MSRHWLDDFAAWLARSGFGAWVPDGAYPTEDADWPIVIDNLPARPDRVIALSSGAATPAPIDHEPHVQVLVRGDTDPRTSRDVAEALWAHLHFLTGGAQLAPDLFLVTATGLNGGATWLGADGNHRHTHVTNHRLTLSALSTT